MRWLSGFLGLGVGGGLLTPWFRMRARRVRDWQFAHIPGLARLPFARSLYGDRMQDVVRVIVAAGFIAFGILTLAGVVETA